MRGSGGEKCDETSLRVAAALPQTVFFHSATGLYLTLLHPVSRARYKPWCCTKLLSDSVCVHASLHENTGTGKSHSAAAQHCPKLPFLAKKFATGGIKVSVALTI